MSRHCIVCNSVGASEVYQTKDRMFDVGGLFTIKRCVNCNLLFIDPAPNKKDLNRHYISSQYYSYKAEITGLSGLISKFRSYLVRHYYSPSIVSNLFSKFVKGVPALPTIRPRKNSKVLDVGCGSGHTLALLKELGWQVYGLEIDKRAVNIANQRGLNNVKLGGILEINKYPDSYFDCVRLYHVIEHLDSPDKTLAMIYKKLKPQGEVIIGTPNSQSMMRRLFGKWWYNLDTPRHLYVFSVDNLKSLMIKTGFTNISSDYCSSDGLGRSIVYMLNDLFSIKLDSNKFTLMFFIFYPIEWLLDKFELGDIFTQRGIKPTHGTIATTGQPG